MFFYFLTFNSYDRKHIEEHLQVSHLGSLFVFSLPFNDSYEETKVMCYWHHPFLVDWVGWVFACSVGEKPFSVGLVDQLFQPVSNQIETVEKAVV